MKSWLSHTRKDNENTSGQASQNGILLLLEPGRDFHKIDEEHIQKKIGESVSGTRTPFKFMLGYLVAYRKMIFQLMLGLLLGSLLQLIFPFLTQSIVDFGINYRDINFIYLILGGQLMLMFSQTIVEFIRGWILMQISSRVNINLISDFLIKLMKLPIAFFDTKMTGDILQRIQDHTRIENFLTNSTLNTLFSFFNLIIFGGVLAYYNLPIFGIFLIGSIFYMIWVTFFMKRRMDLDYKRFSNLRDNQDKVLQLINGMQEIKLHNCEQEKRWEWERIQAKLFKINLEGLKVSQNQQAGGVVINEIKNILITFVAAKAVISGDMTLGMMLSVQYIIGQLNSPINQMINFIHSAQDARISLERLMEIHGRKDETVNEAEKIQELPENKTIQINNIDFYYPGAEDEAVLRNVTLQVPKGKITAIVGTSGSGKTTLIKLLLQFYKPAHGDIRVGDYDLYNVSSRLWRSKCGVVMQDGFIFSDTIARNIAVGDEHINREKLMKAVEVANIKKFIETLPLGYNTKIGSDGHGLSAGQKQRILIARSVYKDPEYIFFDEATNALDANNEKTIMENLNEFFKGRTVIVVAHRLSTVKNADQIIVLERGNLIERGTHEELTKQKGQYYNLVKNQLELGN